MLTAIRQWVLKTMMKNNTGVVQTLPKRDLIELNTQITAQRLMQNGVDPEALKNEIYNVTEKYKGFIIAIAPEGTRKKVERLKSGFLRIANETNSRIMMAGIDFSNKTIELGDFFSPSGDVDKDLKFIKEYFSNFSGKRPELS